MPDNPLRDHPNYRPRGPKRYSYTIRDVCRLAGMAESTLYLRIKAGDIQLGDFESVVRFLAWPSA